MARRLEIEIVGDASSYQRALGQASHQSAGFGSSLRRMAKAGVLAAGVAGVGALFVTLRTGFEEIAEGQKVMAQTNAVLKSTGGIANVTAGHVDQLAQSQSRLTGIDDELVQVGENLLLTFKNVRNELGAGNAVFDRATKSALDLSVAGFGSVESSAKMLGKALNDPIRGMTALGRAGVTFSEDQRAAIKALVETGDVLGAQKLILAEVESQVGGSAKAYGETLPGQLAKAKNAFGEVSGQLTTELLPAATATLQGFTTFLNWVQDNIPAWKTAVVENSQPVIDILTKIWKRIDEDVIPVFKQLSEAAVEYWGEIAKVFEKHGPEIRRIIERISDVVGPLIKAWLFLAQEVVIPIIKPLFTDVIPTALGITITILDKTTAALEGVVKVFKWLGTNSGPIFKKILAAITAPIEAMISLFERLAAIIGAVKRAVDAVLDAIANIKIPSLPSIKIPFRQHGGPVGKGRPYVVGEAGPELFIPNASGRIMPNGSGSIRAAGGGGAVINLNFYGPTIGSSREFEDQIRKAIFDVTRRNVTSGLSLA